MPNFFFVLVAVLLASTADSIYAAEDVGLGPLAFLALAALVPVALGEILRRKERARDMRGLQAPLRLLLVSPLALYAALLFAGGWTQFAKHAEPWGLESVRFLLLLAPYPILRGAVALAFLRTAFGAAQKGGGLGALFKLFLFALLPILLYLGASDLLNQFRDARIVLASIGLARFAASALFFIALVLLLPLAARYLWNTESLPAGPLRDRLETIAQKFRFRCRDILVWRTGAGVVNAAILGLLPRFRYVILTDGLVSSLEPQEIEGVFGHELGHALRHHVAALLAFVVGSLLLMLAFAEGWLADTTTSLVIALAYLGLLWFLIGAIGRRFELEADLFGAGATGDAMIFVQALEKVGAYSGRGRWHGSWRHFSIAERVYFLQHEAADAQRLARFERKMRWARWGGAIFFLAAAGLYVKSLASNLPVDLAEWHVRRGEFKQAYDCVDPVHLDSKRAEALWTISDVAIRIREEAPREWPLVLARRGRELFIERRFSASYYHLSLLDLLELGGVGTARLAQAALFLAYKDWDGLGEFLAGEGKPLLDDPEIQEALRSRE